MNNIKNTLNIYYNTPVNTSKRFNCPFCNGVNTFSVTNTGSKIQYHCFRAACKNSSGSISSTPTIQSVKSQLEGSTDVKKDFTTPDYWVMGIASKNMLQMLLNTNSYHAYSLGMFKIAYDPKENRLVYLIQDSFKVVGAVGRAIDRASPKVKNYHVTDIPFHCGTGDTAILVEDCASACSAASDSRFTGIALLGTNLRYEYIPFISKYKKIIIALDKDALKKSIDLKKKLSYYCKDISILRLSKDLKDMNREEISKL